MIDRIRCFILFMIMFGLIPSWAAVDTMTGVFDEKTKTLEAHIDGYPFAPLVLNLGSPDRLIVSFDRLEEDREYFRYSLEHCNARWQPSGLVTSEFLNGYNEATIEDYEFSRATTVHYVHYTLSLPNEDMDPLISGNYLLKIYPEEDPDSPIAQIRFSVSENSAHVYNPEVTAATDRGYRNGFQQLSFEIDTEHARVDDPFNDMFVVISQNGRLDNERAVLHPLRLKGKTAIYEHMPELIFNAGNEYRRFEIVNTQYPTMGVENIAFVNPLYHIDLYEDEIRSGSDYLYDQTQHGRFFIREYNSRDSDIEADYIMVHFTLDASEMPEKAVFIDGDFTYRRFDPSSRMFYNPSTDRYEGSFLLKQGAYNYQYLTIKPGDRSGDTSTIEGDKWQTVNEYVIKVYHRRRGERFDRLIGIGGIVSDY